MMAEGMSDEQSETHVSPRWCVPAAIVAGVLGLGLMTDTARSISATYDEVTYLRVAARWWRTGRETEITRMGSPLTFWKAQQVATLWLLDRSGFRHLIDDPIGRQAELLPILRAGSFWIWVVAFCVTLRWSRDLYGPRAMALAAWLFALGPNLLAHGSLITMELPVVAGTAGTSFLFWKFVNLSRKRDLWASAIVSGLTFSSKFTAVLLPPLLAIVWLRDLRVNQGQKPLPGVLRVARGMVGFVLVMLLADWAVTGFALLPLSRRVGNAHPVLEGRWGAGSMMSRLVSRAIEIPIPQDWVGFATQVIHQKSGGPSYLLGERRMSGWWYYYLVALAVKVPLTCWLVFALRCMVGNRIPKTGRDGMLPTMMVCFLFISVVGSSRNYGVRYLLPMAPLAIVWVSGLAETKGWTRTLAWMTLIGPALAVSTTHPDELTYFNVLTGGRIGGRHVLADSNLDWGQGLRALARLQRKRPELRDVTLYYFGDTKPEYYGVKGLSRVVDAVNPSKNLPKRFEATTPYLAVSASLQWGPWGPPGYFKALKGIQPIALTDDTTIAIYRTSDVFGRVGQDLGQ